MNCDTYNYIFSCHDYAKQNRNQQELINKPTKIRVSPFTPVRNLDFALCILKYLQLKEVSYSKKGE